MIRVTNLDESLDFFCGKLGMQETRRVVHERARYTIVFAAPEGGEETPIELTLNWDPEEYTGARNFGHLAFYVDDIYACCDQLMRKGVTINRPPRDGKMAFIRTPENISIELIQQGPPQRIKEP